ncbi:hypothetical protein RRG08_066157 [Elysia crispata]|uniref:Uncharacterized protein n=1 Tax=Elysia crispata TaxID=231223 RepID=A0AAE0ZR71_9GAST|nr:hypothetical protein RRG08_066157 [Elysia crispata]
MDDKIIFMSVRRKSHFCPVFQAKKHLPLREPGFLFRKQTILMSFQNEKDRSVLLPSTMHSVPEICLATGKSNIVLSFNSTKEGVDAMDRIAHTFTVKRKSKRRLLWQERVPENKLSDEDNASCSSLLL